MDSRVNFEEVLPKKCKIKFRMLNSSIWYTTIVENVKGYDLTLAFPEMFAAAEIIHGDTIICRYSDSSHDYTFVVDIDSIDISFPQVIKAKIFGEVGKTENNNSPDMVETLFLSNIFVNGELQGLYSYVREVGDSRITVVSKYSISEGSEVGVDIVLPLRNIFDSVVKLKGRIISSKAINNRNEYCVEILQMADSDRNRLKQYINSYSG